MCVVNTESISDKHGLVWGLGGVFEPSGIAVGEASLHPVQA